MWRESWPTLHMISLMKPAVVVRAALTGALLIVACNSLMGQAGRHVPKPTSAATPAPAQPVPQPKPPVKPKLTLKVVGDLAMTT